MYRDPKKNYPPVRVRLVDYKTKVMYDYSIPSEYFEDAEIENMKDVILSAFNTKVTFTPKEQVEAEAVTDRETHLSDEELQDVEKNMFSEEEKDGDE